MAGNTQGIEGSQKRRKKVEANIKMVPKRGKKKLEKNKRTRGNKRYRRTNR